MKLKETRLEKGMGQADVAIKVGVSLSSYRMWEKGVTKPNEENMAKLKEVLNIK